MLTKKEMRRRGIKPLTKVNVKPYFAIVNGNEIWCDKRDGIPVVFDTRELAEGFVDGRGLEKYELKEFSLEELVHMCRSPNFPFDSFYLIDDKSQI